MFWLDSGEKCIGINSRQYPTSSGGKGACTQLMYYTHFHLFSRKKRKGRKSVQKKKKKKGDKQNFKCSLYNTFQPSVPIKGSSDHQNHTTYSYLNLLSKKRSPQTKVAKATGARKLAGCGSYPITPPPRTFPRVSLVSFLWFRREMLYEFLVSADFAAMHRNLVHVHTIHMGERDGIEEKRNHTLFPAFHSIQPTSFSSVPGVLHRAYQAGPD